MAALGKHCGHYGPQGEFVIYSSLLCLISGLEQDQENLEQELLSALHMVCIPLPAVVEEEELTLSDFSLPTERAEKVRPKTQDPERKTQRQGRHRKSLQLRDALQGQGKWEGGFNKCFVPSIRRGPDVFFGACSLLYDLKLEPELLLKQF
ncbi:hypothetical protein B0H13DRAFT_1900914 [Mycena leptocephala]|nr:hypothetical protein B0H13DRAFT_1900914 [Mycena leptocephala]